MKNIKQTLINTILPIISAMAVAGLAYAVWVEPGTTPPPEGNVPAPINVGPDNQSKEGALGIWGVLKTYTETILATDGNGNPSGNVGIGTNNPNSPAPNGMAAGNLDVNDIFLRSIGQWASAAGGGGGGCYVDYSLAQNLPVGSPCKVSGFTNKGSAGLFGLCGGYSYCGWECTYLTYFSPAGGGCSAWGSLRSAGEAYVCCQ